MVEDTEQWLVQIRKGVVELAVLRLLKAKGELHGYALIRELQSLGPLISGENTVYPIVKRLEADGLLVSHWAEAPAGPQRKYYVLSSQGLAFLQKADEGWGAIVDSLDRIREGD